MEAKLNQRNIYLSTNLYLRPEFWDKDTSQVVNHPQSVDLNAMLFEYLLHLQGIELALWKRGIQPTLALLRDAGHKKVPVSISFPTFARSAISQSDKRDSTKENLMTTVSQLEQFRPGLDFADLTYTFLKDFECWLREQGKGVNTVAKHMRQLRTLINEAINDGYMPADSYPFRKFKIKQEKPQKPFLTPDELRKLENLVVHDQKIRHALDAFLFCCYTGLRYSDFRSLNNTNLIQINRSPWLCVDMLKTNITVRLPLAFLFNGKAMQILNSYPNMDIFSSIPVNSDTNKILSEIAQHAKIRKHFTFHTARHTCATLLVHQGVAITTVQKILGHTSVKTTQIYSEVMSDTIIKDLKSVNRKLKV